MGKCSDDVASGGRSSQQSDDVPLSLLKRAISWGDCRPSLGLVALFSAEKKGRGEAGGGGEGSWFGYAPTPPEMLRLRRRGIVAGGGPLSPLDRGCWAPVEGRPPSGDGDGGRISDLVR